MYLVSPLCGHLVDRTGQRIALALAGLCLFIGYYGLHVAYLQAWEHQAPWLCLLSFMTGVGSSLGNSAVLNACAKSYPHNRGSATAFPIAAYGLSAFVFSRISHALFPGDTGSFLLVLSIACGCSLLASSFVVGVFHARSDTSTTRKSTDSESETGELLADESESQEQQAESLAEVTGWGLLKSRDFQLMISTLALCKLCHGFS